MAASIVHVRVSIERPLPSEGDRAVIPCPLT